MAATTLTRASAVTPDTKRLRVPREFIDACDVLSLKPSYQCADARLERERSIN